MTRPAARVRCPASRCGAVFELSDDRLGHNVYCLECGTRMTARPIEIESQLEARQRSVKGGAGADRPRLPLAVLVDNVRSLWNVGSIFRTADICGVRELVLTGITGCPPRSEITKTALGAEDEVAWRYFADAEKALQMLRADGFTAVALEATPRAVPLPRMRWPARTCLVVGNEVAGVAPALLEACDRHVVIPMYGVKDSLNVAVAFGIAVHDAARSLIESTPAVETTGGES